MSVVIDDTRRWFERAVIGLNLCPFAKAVHAKQQIRWVDSAAADAESLLADLVDELQRLAAADPEDIDTTLLIHPHALTDFDAYNDFLDVADAAVEALGLTGTIQIASFHPDYRFADAPADAVDHCTNRSPYPMLQLLREASVERAVEAYPDAAEIWERNVETLRRLGWIGWRRLLEEP